MTRARLARLANGAARPARRFYSEGSQTISSELRRPGRRRRAMSDDSRTTPPRTTSASACVQSPPSRRRKSAERPFHKDVVHNLTKVTHDRPPLAPDLESFQRHSKRGTIGVEDVLLAARKNDTTKALIAEHVDELAASKHSADEATLRPPLTRTRPTIRRRKSQTQHSSSSCSLNLEPPAAIRRTLSRWAPRGAAWHAARRGP